MTVVAVGLASAYATVSPDGRLLRLLLLALGLACAFAVPPHLFVALSVLAFGVSTAFRGAVVPSLPVPLYFYDFVVLLVAMRAAIPRSRRRPTHALAGAPTLAFAFWILLMAIAAVRGMAAGVPYASAIRGDLALFYWILLYFGYTRILRERSLDLSRLWWNLATVAVGLATWMFVARVLNHPFNDPGLANVPTGEMSTVPRNFGFASAFIIYPALALVGIAGMAHVESRGRRWMIFAIVGTVATLLTLVRGEIFSLAIGALLILWLRPQTAESSARALTAAKIAFFLVTATMTLMVISPTLGNAIVQRALPFTHQSAGAQLNAKYRQKAVLTGAHVANRHAFGLGVLDLRRLYAENIDPSFLAHSGVGTLLLFGGWGALVTGVVAIALAIRRSFRTRAPTRWLHPAFVGVIVMLGFYSVGAAGLAGDPWVIPLGAVAVALRFAVPE